MWLQSPNSELWLDRRLTFTQTLAANSMVGYVLGLGDRHPSNLMIDNVVGTVRTIALTASCHLPEPS